MGVGRRGGRVVSGPSGECEPGPFQAECLCRRGGEVAGYEESWAMLLFSEERGLVLHCLPIQGIRTERILSSEKGPAIRTRIAMNRKVIKVGKCAKETVIPSKTSANGFRTIRLQSKGQRRCLNRDMGGTIRGVGAHLTSTVVKRGTLGRT